MSKTGGSGCALHDAPSPNMQGGARKKKVVKKKVSKRKPNPYALFVKKNFATVQKNNPKWKATDVVKEIAKMWKKK